MSGWSKKLVLKKVLPPITEFFLLHSVIMFHICSHSSFSLLFCDFIAYRCGAGKLWRMNGEEWERRKMEEGVLCPMYQTGEKTERKEGKKNYFFCWKWLQYHTNSMYEYMSFLPLPLQNFFFILLPLLSLFFPSLSLFSPSSSSFSLLSFSLFSFSTVLHSFLWLEYTQDG